MSADNICIEKRLPIYRWVYFASKSVCRQHLHRKASVDIYDVTSRIEKRLTTKYFFHKSIKDKELWLLLFVVENIALYSESQSAAILCAM